MVCRAVIAQNGRPQEIESTTVKQETTVRPQQANRPPGQILTIEGAARKVLARQLEGRWTQQHRLEGLAEINALAATARHAVVDPPVIRASRTLVSSVLQRVSLQVPDPAVRIRPLTVRETILALKHDQAVAEIAQWI